MSRWTQKPPLGAQIDWSHPLSRGLVGCWLMNEGGNHYSYHLQDLTMNKNIGYRGGGDAKWIPGNKGTALLFDGANDFVTFLPKPSLNLGNNMTVLVSFCPLRVSAYETIVCKIEAGFASGWEIANSSGGIRCSLRGAYLNAEVVGTLLAGLWYQAAFTYNGITLNLYLNGIRVDSQNGSSTLNSTLPLLFANREAGMGGFFNGLISYVYIWNRALSAQEIRQLYAEPYCFIQPATKAASLMPMFRGLITFDRVLTPAGSFWPTHNPNYGDGYVRTIRRHQPKSFCGADLYSYNKGASENLSLGWNRMPTADLASLVAFFDSLHGAANKFVFTDRDGGVHTAQLINDDSLTWREVEPGYHEVQVDLDLS